MIDGAMSDILPAPVDSVISQLFCSAEVAEACQLDIVVLETHVRGTRRTWFSSNARLSGPLRPAPLGASDNFHPDDELSGSVLASLHPSIKHEKVFPISLIAQCQCTEAESYF